MYQYNKGGKLSDREGDLDILHTLNICMHNCEKTLDWYIYCVVLQHIK